MISYADGPINEFITVAGSPMYPAYIVRGGRQNLMVDAGVDLLGAVYLEALVQALGGANKLDYLFVTHSHYDHVGSVSYLKKRVTGLTFGAHSRLDTLLNKASVIARMRDLSRHQRDIFKNIAVDEDDRIEPVSLDITLKEGDRVDLGGLTVEVVESPGHTRDSLAYLIPETRVLFTGEALGIPMSGDARTVQVEFISSYDDYVHSIDKLAALSPEMLCLGHGWVLTGSDVNAYFETTRQSTVAYKKLIEEYLDRAGGDEEQATRLMATEQYDNTETVYQERNAYMANLRGQVGLISRLRDG
jgi:glyoxylase-like metal-dependent hydrolase (beta-lactamase superfamily II)